MESSCFHTTARRAPKPHDLFNQVISPVCREHQIRAMHGSHLGRTGEVAALSISSIQDLLFVTVDVSESSPDVEYELGAAIALRKPIVPFLIDNFMASPLDAARKLETIRYSLKTETEVEKPRQDFDACLAKLIASPALVPATNRYVSIADNQQHELLSATKILVEKVKEERSNEFHDKEEKLAELAALELLLSKPRISAPLLEKILSDTVADLARRFVDQAVGNAAAVLWSASMILLGKAL